MQRKHFASPTMRRVPGVLDADMRRPGRNMHEVIRADVEAFLAAGNKITEVPVGVGGGDAWREARSKDLSRRVKKGAKNRIRNRGEKTKAKP